MGKGRRALNSVTGTRDIVCEAWDVQVRLCHIVFTQQVGEEFHSAPQLVYLVGVSSSLATALPAPVGPSLTLAKKHAQPLEKGDSFTCKIPSSSWRLRFQLVLGILVGPFPSCFPSAHLFPYSPLTSSPSPMGKDKSLTHADDPRPQPCRIKCLN